MNDWSPKSQYELSGQIQRVFRSCQESLADGKLVGEVRYTSIYEAPPSSRGNWKPIEIPNHPDPETRGPLSKIDFETLAERNENALRHLTSVRDYIANKCIEVLDAHESLVRNLIDIKERGLSGLPSSIAKPLEVGKNPKRGRIPALEPADRIQVALYLVERDCLYRATPKDTLILREQSILEPLAMKVSAHWLFDALLSDYYLPRIAVTACAVILAMETGWNIETLYSMSASDVVKTDIGYTLLGIKSRIKRRQTALVLIDTGPPPSNKGHTINGDAGDASPSDKAEHEDEDGDRDITTSHATRAIELLLAHNRRIEFFTSQVRPPLLASLRLQRGHLQIFELYSASTALRMFTKKLNLPKLVFRDFRHLYAHINYLSPDGDIFTVSVILNHADLATTSEYLHSTITKALQDANILRYMNKLAASILWVCGREDIISKKKIDRKYIDEKLLFPASPMQAEGTDCLIDQWINSSGETQLLIGEEEILHCALQYEYYFKHFNELINANMERFSRFHLPRIVICVALRRVILASRHRSVLTKFEESSNGTPFFKSENQRP
ncbi:hypothetical protein PQR71_12020 [Paraburkholderia fungorum]|uniref:hypothetical protein n=1 Tax=Paraburkholderia fungorum TaxID=134537 RepID=UPI0038BB827A